MCKFVVMENSKLEDIKKASQNNFSSIAGMRNKEAIEKQKNMSSEVKSNIGGIQFHFGKYKYKTVKTVCQKDMRYIQWLLNNEDFVFKTK